MELKERIIIETTRMFYQSGIKAVRMDDIAAQCGISKRTLYETFSDREQLIKECIGYHVEKHERALDEKLKDAENVLQEFVISFSEGSNMRAANHRVMKDLVKFHPVIFKEFIGEHQKQVLGVIIDRFERGIQEGLIMKQVDAAFVAQMLGGYLYGLRDSFADNDFLDFAGNNLNPRSLKFAIMTFLRGVTTEKGRRYIDDKILGITESGTDAMTDEQKEITETDNI